MIALYVLASYIILWYSSLVKSYFNDRKNNELPIKASFTSIYVALVFPLYSSYVHIRGAIHCFRDKEYKHGFKFILLATVLSSTGISLLNEFIISVLVNETVYETDINGKKLDRKSEVKSEESAQKIFKAGKKNDYTQVLPAI